jgi:hypothetical protein
VTNDGSVNDYRVLEYPNDTETRYTFSFGPNYCRIPIIDKALELQSSSAHCNEAFQERYSDSKDQSLVWLESKECDWSDACCIQRVKDVIYIGFDKEIEWKNCIRNNRGCEMCLGTGKLTRKTCYYLQDIPDPYYKKSVPIHKTTYPWDVKNRECNPMEKTTFYRINNLTINQGEVLNISYEQGRCSKYDQCCVKFRYAEKSDKTGVTQCYDDICMGTLHGASFMLNKTIDVNHWKTIDIYNLGRNWGGKLCNSLQNYGYSVLLLVLFHSLFGFFLFCDDIKREKASYFEAVFAFFSFYPQWKVIKLWLRYAVGNINAEQLREEKIVLGATISSIEPFVESCFQVHM